MAVSNSEYHVVLRAIEVGHHEILLHFACRTKVNNT